MSSIDNKRRTNQFKEDITHKCLRNITVNKILLLDIIESPNHILLYDVIWMI